MHMEIQYIVTQLKLEELLFGRFNARIRGLHTVEDES